MYTSLSDQCAKGSYPYRHCDVVLYGKMSVVGVTEGRVGRVTLWDKWCKLWYRSIISTAPHSLYPSLLLLTLLSYIHLSHLGTYIHLDQKESLLQRDRREKTDMSTEDYDGEICSTAELDTADLQNSVTTSEATSSRTMSQISISLPQLLPFPSRGQQDLQAAMLR